MALKAFHATLLSSNVALKAFHATLLSDSSALKDPPPQVLGANSAPPGHSGAENATQQASSITTENSHSVGCQAAAANVQSGFHSAQKPKAQEGAANASATGKPLFVLAGAMRECHVEVSADATFLRDFVANTRRWQPRS